MKTMSFIIAATLVIGVAVGAVAKADPAVASLAVVSSKGSEIVKVIYKGAIAGKVKLNIYNAASALVFTETRSVSEGFILPLNFRGLAAGEYIIELVDGAGVRSERINFQPAKSLSSATVHVAKLNDEGKFLLSVVKNTTETITVRVFNQDKLVHTSTKQADGDFAQIFSIKNYSGACTFEVSNAEGKSTVIRF